MKRWARQVLVIFAALSITLSLSQTPQYGGVYRMLSIYGISTLDPARAGNFEDWWSAGLILFGHLYKFDGEGNLYPDVASGMPTISEDGRVFTIPLRQGVKFSNGRELVADDVLFTFERVANPETASWGIGLTRNIVGAEAYSLGEAESISGIRVIDDYTIEFTLIEPQSTFTAMLSNSVLGIVPRQEVLEAGSDWGTEVLIGSGPFTLTDFIPGEKVVYSRNEHYYKEGLPYLDGIEIYMDVDLSVAALRHEAGEAEFVPADSLPPAELLAAQTDPAYEGILRKDPTGVITTLIFNPASRDFQDPRVRQAVAHAIDTESLALRSGRGLPHNGLFPTVYPQFNPDFEYAFPYNPERARELLAEAGYPNGISGYAMLAAQGQELGEMIQADLAAVGINIEVLTGSPDIYRDRFQSGEIIFGHYGAAGGFLDGSEMIRGRFICFTEAELAAVPNRIQKLCDPEVDAKFFRTDLLPIDSPERTALLQEIENDIINVHTWVIVPYHSAGLGLGQPYVFNDNLHPIYALPTLEDAWMAQ